MRLALADAFDLGRVQRIELLAALLLALLAHALGEQERAAKDLAQACVVLDLAHDVAADPARDRCARLRSARLARLNCLAWA